MSEYPKEGVRIIIENDKLEAPAPLPSRERVFDSVINEGGLFA